MIKYTRNDLLSFRKKFIPTDHIDDQTFVDVAGGIGVLSTLMWFLLTEQYGEFMRYWCENQHSGCKSAATHLLLEEQIENLPLKISGDTCKNCPHAPDYIKNPPAPGKLGYDFIFGSDAPHYKKSLCREIAKWRLERGH